MLISMTGFGRSVCKTIFGRITVEIQSVNRKHLELFISLPKEFTLYELELRKSVAERIGRGQVSLRVFLSPDKKILSGLLPDATLLKQIKESWIQLASECGYDEKSIDLPLLLQTLSGLPQNAASEWKEEELGILKECVFEAVEAVIEMKRQEGTALERDIRERLYRIDGSIQEIEKLSPDQISRQRAKLSERMKELLEPGGDLDERLLREIAFFAERIDISEEITRMRSHLEQFQSVLRSEESSVGRKLEFVLQEMGREINTIGSKSQDAAISRLVVETKSDLEKIREQIQNIE